MEHVFVVKVNRAGPKPILLPLERKRFPWIPAGATQVVADGQTWTFSFVKVAVNVATRGAKNELGALLLGWFGPAAGAPGTRHYVKFWREGGVWHVAADREVSS